jgi:hypothetical protein
MTRPHITKLYAAQPEHRRTGFRWRSIFLSPHAKVRRKASAKSGERMPRFFMSALLSTTILPVEVKLYVGAVSSGALWASLGIAALPRLEGHKVSQFILCTGSPKRPRGIVRPVLALIILAIIALAAFSSAHRTSSDFVQLTLKHGPVPAMFGAASTGSKGGD